LFEINEKFRFRRYSVSDGLSQNIVYSVNQDKKGFIWVCTQQGLNRFDGKEFLVYRNEPGNMTSILNNLVYTSLKSSDGTMWFGLINGGFCRYNSETDNFENFTIPKGMDSKESKLLIFDIAEDKQGAVYLSVFGSGIYKFYPDKKTFSKEKSKLFDNELLKKSTKLKFDAEGNFWIGTWDNGLFRFDFKKNLLTNYCQGNKKKILSNNRVRFIFSDSKERIWAGTQSGLNLFDSERDEFINPMKDKDKIMPDNSNAFSCMEEDKNGDIWIGTSSSGIIKYKESESRFTMMENSDLNPESISGNSIMHLFCDRTNVMWAGTYDNGLNKTDVDRKKFFGFANLFDRQIHKLSVISLLEDEGRRLYIGTSFNGLYVFIFGETELHKQRIFKDGKELSEGQTVTCIYRDSYGKIFFSLLANGLFELEIETGKTRSYCYPDLDSEFTIFSITELDKDNLLLGTRSNSLLIFNKKKRTFIEVSGLRQFKNKLPEIEFKALLKDRSGEVWAGSDAGGLLKIGFEKGKIRQYLNNPGDKNSLSEDYITSLCEDEEGNVWIGTLSRGLNKYCRKKDCFERYTVEHGLADNAVRAVVSDKEGNIWISTNNGISKFYSAKNAFKNFETGDGLQSREFNDRAVFKSKDGIIYFGGINGINFFKPEEIKDNEHIPEVALTDFKLFNHSVINSPENPFLKKSITETEDMELTYRESVISFEFASLIYNNVSKNKYAYRMEGFDNGWTYCGSRRFATYTSLKPGNYIFRVIACNNDEVWNKEGVTLKIYISPPFWKTWWFKSLGIAAAAGMTGIAYTNKLNKIKKEKTSQEEFSRRLLESRETERKKISSGLHNTIAHGILITKNKAEIARKHVGDKDKMNETLEQISSLSSSTLNDLRSITYNLHPHQLERLGLTKAVKSIVNNVEKSTEIQFTVYLDNIDNIFPADLEINIYRIVQECLNNIIKHSEATKSVLKFTHLDNSVEITITDNGKGISQDAVKGIGMNELNERVKLYYGNLQILTSPGKGTTIIISIPINKNHESR